MDIYIANPTEQRLEFNYCVIRQRNQDKFLSNVITAKVPPRSQLKLTGSYTQEDIDYIILKNSKYGLVPFSDIGKYKEYINMCYSIDKPIASHFLQRAIIHNHNWKEERGKKLRSEAALAENSNMLRILQEQGRPETLQSYATSIVEERPAHDRSDLPLVAEGYKVIQQPKQVAKRSRKK